MITPRHSRSQALIDYAYRYAKEAHGDQKRKYMGEPYITHPLAVAHIVAGVTTDCQMICVALLHDVIEDTPRTFEDIRDAGFGYDIANMVRDLSDVGLSFGNRKTRKKIDRDRLAECSGDVHTVKLADIIHNTLSIVKYDPDFSVTYMKEIALTLDILMLGDSTLYQKALDLVQNYQQSKLDKALRKGIC